MKNLMFLFAFLFPTYAFSAVSTGFFDGIFIFFSDIWNFIVVTIPYAITRFFVFVSTYALYIKFLFIKSSITFSHSVAIGFLDMVNISSVVNNAISSLPADMRQAAQDIRFFDGLTLIIEAAITRFVYQSST